MKTLTLTALIRRVNRKLAHDGLRLHVTRARLHYDLGLYHVENNGRVLQHVLWNVGELEDFARRRGCLGTKESVVMVAEARA